MSYTIPQNSWELYLDTVSKANDSIAQILAGQPMGPLLNQFIHVLVFQQGICAARWINNNADLVRRLNSIQSFTKDEFDELAVLVKASVDKLRSMPVE